MIAVSLLAAGFLVAWLRFRPYLGTEGAFTDGERTIEIEQVDELRYAIWDDPAPLPGELNSDEPESAPVLSPDGRYMVFVVGARGLGTDIWVCDLDRSGRALEPRPLIGVNSSADELAPTFTSDGALLFASNRPGGEGGLDLWRSGYDRGVFGRPEHLGGRGLNTPADETDPAAVPGSSAILFTSNRLTEEEKAARATRQFDIYSAEPLPIRDGAEVVWEVHALDGINTTYDERDPALTVDGRALLFASNRGTIASDLFGLRSSHTSRTDTDFDLFRAARRPVDHPDPEFTDDWLPPRPLEGVNTDASERYPRATPDGFALLFARGDGITVDASGQRRALPESEVNWDVWRATSREVVRTPGKPVGWREIIVLVALLLLALLAALAKRWKGMDVIYKAFLISLLIHLALLFLARDVVPESGRAELREGDPNRVRVRLVEDPNSLRAQRNEERGGRVEAARSEAEAARDLTRAELEAATATEVATASAAMESLERAEAALAEGPTPMDASEPEREMESEQAHEQSIAEAREAFERKTGEAAPLAVAASRVEGHRTERTAADVARDQAAAAVNTEVATTEAPRAALFERSRSQREPAQDAPTRRSVRVDRSAAASAVQESERAPTITGPEIEFDRKVADARTASDPLRLSQSDEARLSSRSNSGSPRLKAEAPRHTRTPGESLAASPSATSDLQRSRASASGLGPVALPTAVRPLIDPGRRAASVEMVLASPTGEAQIQPSNRPAAPAFNALEGAGQAAPALDRSKEPRAELAGPVREVAESGVSAGLASASDLAPSAMAQFGRRRSRTVPEGPSFALPGRSSAAEELKRISSPGGAREVKVAGLAFEPVPGPAGADAPSGVDSIVADLAPTDAGPLRRRDRGEGTPEGPGRLAPVARRGGAVGFAAPAPVAIALKAPDAPRRPQGVAAAKLSPEQWDRTPYQSRTGDRKIAALAEYGGGVETERAVGAGLAYLARRQRTDGRWGRKEVDDKYGQPMIGKTGLACLAFMGAGHTPESGTEFSNNVATGLRFLVDSQDPASGHFGNTSSYGHAIATYALGEAYALTSASQFRDPLIRAVQQIVDNQVSSRDPLLDGGWSYFFADGHTLDRWPRVSVSAWQVMALESAKLGGIDVSKSVFARAQTFLVNSWDSPKGAFRYSHDPSRLRSDYPFLPGTTPAAMFALSLLGADIGAPQFAPARGFVHARSPRGYRFTGDDDFVYKAQGNLYFWYYATLAMFRAGGDDWGRWNTAMKETLVPAQEADGSWRPISIYAGYAQDSDGDRSYTTAMNVLTLEVYYRYFTPLLKVE